MDKSNFFIVGIKGVAMCHIAVILTKMGKTVTGADVAEEFITDEVLNQNGITWQTGFDAASLPPTSEVVIYSAAHGGVDNPVVQEAQKKGIAVMSQAAFLGDLLKRFTISVAVCGTHGKTNTSSLLSHALLKLNASPSYMIGSSNFGGDGKTFAGGEYNGTDYFVVEADEYGINPPKDKTPKFHSLHPTHILCMNVDFDHPDMFDSIESVKAAFATFFNQPNVKLIYCRDDAILADMAGSLQAGSAQSYGLSEQSDYKITGAGIRDGKTIFSLYSDGETITDIELSVYGEKNVSNAAGVVAMLLNLGFTPEEIKKAVRGFTGAKRRLEQIFEKDGTYLFDDYGHHPAEISATIAALKQRFPGKRLIVIFQPHTFSRTQSFKKEFTQALSQGDVSLVLPIFASAREITHDEGVTSADLSNGTNVFALEDKNVLTARLNEWVKGGEVIVTMGAGDVYKLSADIIEVIKSL